MIDEESCFAVRRVSNRIDAVAADGSELVLLSHTERSSMAHGTLAAGRTSFAAMHRTIEEIWFVVAGSAEIWRANDRDEMTVIASAGTSLTIPLGTRFQYRTVGDEPFQFIMATTPSWPGDGEAILVEGPWAVSKPGQRR